MASKISSVSEFHEDIERGQKERSCSHCKLQLLSSFLLAAAQGRQTMNLQTPGRDYSPSHFLLDVRIFKNSIGNQASLITLFTDFLDYANHWKPRNCLLSHTAFPLNVSDFTVQHSEVTGVVLYMTSLLSEMLSVYPLIFAALHLLQTEPDSAPDWPRAQPWGTSQGMRVSPSGKASSEQCQPAGSLCAYHWRSIPEHLCAN